MSDEQDLSSKARAFDQGAGNTAFGFEIAVSGKRDHTGKREYNPAPVTGDGRGQGCNCAGASQSR